MAQDDFTINNVSVKEVTEFARDGSSHKVTVVRMFVGADGPFMEKFGPGTGRADDLATINTWKQSTVAKVMSLRGQ